MFRILLACLPIVLILGLFAYGASVMSSNPAGGVGSVLLSVLLGIVYAKAML